MTNGTQWRSWLINDHWFNELPGQLQDSLLKTMQQRRVTPGKLIITRGYPACGIYALLEGDVRVSTTRQQRSGTPPRVFRRPYWFGEVSLFDSRCRLRDVYSMSQTIMLHMPQPKLLALLEAQPQYWRYFADLLGRKLSLTVPRPEQLNHLPTLERVAFRLLMLVEGYGAINHAVPIVCRDDLTCDRSLGLVPEVVDRTLLELCERNIIRWDHHFISVQSVDKLRNAARHRLTDSAMA